MKRTAGRAGGESLLCELNAAQRQAVEATEGPLLVLAGAGTGKTRVITYRIANLLRRGVPPGSILGVTFTNKAAREMRERIAGLLGRRPDGLTLSTFHALGARILRAEVGEAGLRPNFTIYDASDQVALLRVILRDIRGAATTVDARAVLHAISLSKNRLDGPVRSPAGAGDDPEDDRWRLIARAGERYREELRSLNAVDFDDLILLPLRLLEESEAARTRLQGRFRYILVDEYQDTNGAQYRFTRALVGPDRNLCVVGDDDQSIYGFRGAERDRILGFERDFPGARVVRLEENYRSTGCILELANAVIASCAERHPKRLRSTLGPGEPVEWVEVEDGEAEAVFVAQRIQELCLRERMRFDDIAVLMRSAAQARPLEEILRLRRIPYTLVGGQSYFDRKEIRDALAYWNVAHNPRDDLSLLRILNFPRRGLGSAAVARLDKLARSRRSPLLEALGEAARGEGDLPGPARQGARALRETFERAAERIARGECLAMCRGLLEEVGYRAALADLYPEPATARSRWAAVEELFASVERWERERRGESLGSFLGSLALESQEDRDGEKEDIRGVALMTLHSAKGLEFPAVFLSGVEEELLPHRKAIEEGDRAVEEERRLFYVGITRARRRLFLTSAATRMAAGRSRARLPSRFLTELGDRDLFRKSIYDPGAKASPENVRFYLDLYRHGKEHKSAP